MMRIINEKSYTALSESDSTSLSLKYGEASRIREAASTRVITSGATMGAAKGTDCKLSIHGRTHEDGC